MRGRDRFDAMMSILAVASDILTMYGGFMLAYWIRFTSGWIEFDGHPLLASNLLGAGVATAILVYIFYTQELYKRPQYGHYVERIPRIIRCCAIGITLALALGYVVRADPPFSRVMIAISYATVTFLVIVQRNVLFQLERHWAKYQAEKRNVLVLGVGNLAAQLKQSLEGEPRLRYRVTGFLDLGTGSESAVDPGLIRGKLEDLEQVLQDNAIDEVMVANPSAIQHEALMNTIVLCEKNLADFHMVPDLFRLMTSKVDIQSINGMPLVGVSKWPLDFFWNRAIKRLEDIVGAIVGLTLSAPVMLIAALLIKRSSPGPVFYRQERCGENGEPFMLVKLRTMKQDAEQETGPVWASEDDPRRTAIGTFLRKTNLDELPQFWNVLKGEMSLVGPRPERPHFVDQFKNDIQRYMSRHYSKPGITGWAQVNGLRGNTSIEDRIKYDLFYLENWSLSLDFKVLMKTFFANKNAY